MIPNTLLEVSQNVMDIIYTYDNRVPVKPCKYGTFKLKPWKA